MRSNAAKLHYRDENVTNTPVQRRSFREQMGIHQIRDLKCDQISRVIFEPHQIKTSPELFYKKLSQPNST